MFIHRLWSGYQCHYAQETRTGAYAAGANDRRGRYGQGEPAGSDHCSGFFPEGRYELIIAFDVIEHISDDKSTLNAIAKMLQPNGLVIIKVLSCNWLWPEQDNVVHHKRRYTKKSLEELTESTGLKIEKISYFNFLLFLPISAALLLMRLKSHKREVKDFSLTPKLSICSSILYFPWSVTCLKQ